MVSYKCSDARRCHFPTFQKQKPETPREHFFKEVVHGNTTMRTFFMTYVRGLLFEEKISALQSLESQIVTFRETLFQHSLFGYSRDYAALVDMQRTKTLEYLFSLGFLRDIDHALSWKPHLPKNIFCAWYAIPTLVSAIRPHTMMYIPYGQEGLYIPENMVPFLVKHFSQLPVSHFLTSYMATWDLNVDLHIKHPQIMRYCSTSRRLDEILLAEERELISNCSELIHSIAENENSLSCLTFRILTAFS